MFYKKQGRDGDRNKRTMGATEHEAFDPEKIVPVLGKQKMDDVIKHGDENCISRLPGKMTADIKRQSSF